MEYPRLVMRKTELEKMGFPTDWLLSIYRQPGQKIAWKTSPKKNAPIMFDTKALEKFRIASCVAER